VVILLRFTPDHCAPDEQHGSTPTAIKVTGGNVINAVWQPPKGSPGFTNSPTIWKIAK
jgi:hypothetical protein